MPPLVEFEYDALLQEIRAVIHGAVIGNSYTLCSFDPTSDCPTEVADSIDFEMVTSPVTGYVNGDRFACFVGDDDWGLGDSTIAGATFLYGSSSGPLDESELTWSYDGDRTVSVSFVGVNGQNYQLNVQDVDTANTDSNNGTGNGVTPTVITVVHTVSPLTGFYFRCELNPFPNNSPFQARSVRLFQGGVAGAGTQGLGGSAPGADPDRFYESPPWRFLVTDLDGVSLTFLDRRCSSREVVKTLNAPMQIAGRVPSDDPEIFLEYGDGYPVLAEGVRLVYCFRREGNDTTVAADNWIIRAAGVILEVADRGGPDVPDTFWRAFDPWQLLYRRPVRLADGSLPGEAGAVFTDNGNDIVLALLNRTIAEDGPIPLDITSGEFESTESLEITFQQGTSVGEALDALVETGTLDIVMQPIYRPSVDPGIVSELSIYVEAGEVKRDAVMAWDKPSRSLVNIDRTIDGKERVNRAQYYRGQGGPPVPLQSDAASVALFGEYWEQQFFPGMPTVAAVEAIAEAQIRLRARGLITYQMAPAPERSPSPLSEYDIGDYLPIYASQRLRQEISAVKRVQSIPLTIGNDQMEAIGSLLLTDDPDLSS